MARYFLFHQVNIEEINELLENDKTKFPDAPLIWLKDLVSYLDAKVPAEKDDPAFQSKPDTYPLSLVSKAIRLTLEKTIKLAGPQNAQLCWEGTLTTMVRNISNGSPDIGCKIFLQLLAQTNPEMTISNIPKLASLRNSYQNKKPIGLSLLWAFAQSGKKNPVVGLTIWHEIMAPMLESRSYAAYVVKVLKELLSVTKNVNNLTTEIFFNILDDMYSGKINVPSSLENEISACMQNLRVSWCRYIDHIIYLILSSIFLIKSIKRYYKILYYSYISFNCQSSRQNGELFFLLFCSFS